MKETNLHQGAPVLQQTYSDLHEHLEALEKAGLLIGVDRPINKDTEMHPLVRWQFRGGIEEKDRKADASVLIDATLKEDFPPISLPQREYMERARQLWDDLGLPKLKPETPWFGYSLGEWPDELKRAAELAVQGDYFENGKLNEKRRRKDVKMNTEVRDLGPRPDDDD